MKTPAVPQGCGWRVFNTPVEKAPNAMSAEAIIGIVALVLTALGLLCGAAWWMSALYSQVGSIKDNTEATSTKLDTLTEKMDGEMHEVRSVQREQGKDIAELKGRVGRVEGRIEANWGIE